MENITIRPSRTDEGRFAKFVDIEHPEAIFAFRLRDAIIEQNNRIVYLTSEVEKLKQQIKNNSNEIFDEEWYEEGIRNETIEPD